MITNTYLKNNWKLAIKVLNFSLNKTKDFYNVGHFGFFIPIKNIKRKLEEVDNKSFNSINSKTKDKKNKNLDMVNNLRCFSKNMNQNSQSEKDRSEKTSLENEKINKRKNSEAQKDANISRRNSIKQKKEDAYQSRIKDSNNSIKEKQECYDLEEFNKLVSNPKNSEISLFKLNGIYRRNIQNLVKVAVFLIFPISISGVFFIDYFCFDFKKISLLMKFSYYFLISIDYLLFLFGIYLLKKSRNITFSAKLFPKENIVEFTKFNYLGKYIKTKERVVDIKRNRNTWLSPDNSVKSKRTNNIYIFKQNESEIYDIKLFNYLFPMPEVKERKKPSMVDSLWEKN